jgi:hypothetical protein
MICNLGFGEYGAFEISRIMIRNNTRHESLLMLECIFTIHVINI